MEYDDVLTRNDDGELAVRTVSATEQSTVINPNDVYTRDTDGNLCIRTTGGGDNHNKGYFATPEALAEAYPTGEAGDFAIVESTDTVWIWDSDNSEWIDSDQKGQVTSVNNQTGAVTIKTINNNELVGSGNIELSTYLTYPNTWTTNSTTKAFCDIVAADTSATEGKAYLGEVTFSDLPASIANGEVVVEIMSGTTSANKVIVLTLTSGNTAPYMWKYTYWNGGTDVSGWQGFATSAQGAKADTAVQPADLATVATTGLYSDLSGKPTIPDAIQVSTMPTASITEEGKIYQFIGTTDANYTNGYFYKCEAQGTTPDETYAWERVDVQPNSGGLPSQTGNAGKFLITDGTDASWGDTITGLKIVNSSDNTKYITISSDGNFFLQDGSYWRRFQLAKKTSPKQINFILATDETGSATTIGASNSKIDLVYTTKINNGADIAVPTTGGTMAVIGVNTTITLASANWSSNSQTVNVTGMTATGVVFVSPDPSDQSDYTSAGITCTAQAAGTLTFSCDTTPTNDIDVIVVML